MTKSINARMLLVFALGISLLSLQTTSIAVESESHADDVIVVTVDSTNLQFSPSEVVITEGQTVRFFWSGEFLEHNAIESTGFFNSGTPETEVDYSFTFDPGTNNTYSYICEPHESLNMVGTIIVNPAENSTNNPEDNQTYSGIDSENESTNYMYGFLVVPTLVIVVFVSRYFK
tara:strand:- start:3462 stop:3983 length:522 start_codon:yes stop_codon:yes gene_type:complete